MKFFLIQRSEALSTILLLFDKPMRLILFLLIAYLSCVSGSARAQSITLHEKDAALVDVFKKIEKQSVYTFFYNQKELPTEKISIRVSKVTIDEVLRQLFLNLAVDYKVVQHNIVLSPKKSMPATAEPKKAPQSAKGPAMIKGRITTMLGKGIEGVSVVNLDLKKLIFTDADGDFTISGQAGHMLSFSHTGFQKDISKYNGDALMEIKLLENAIEISEVEIKNNNPMTTVDLRNRQHMNLAQVLEGMPGMTIKQSVSSNSVIGTGREFVAYENYFNSPEARQVMEDFGFYSIDQFARFKAITNETVSQIRTTNNGLIPELRGGNGFTSGASSMLIVIDGFPQDNFPADMPMSNIESVETIKDPTEAAKWGARAGGGVILIKTKMGTKGKMAIQYSGNYFFSQRPDISAEAMQLPSSSDFLAAYKEMYDKGIMPVTSFPLEGNPAILLLGKLQDGLITAQTFQQSWDSLGMLSNRTQLRLLQEPILRQNHSLTLSKGWENYQFSLNGLLQRNANGALNNSSTNKQLNLRNNFSLLQQRLKINWNIFYANNHETLGALDNGLYLKPYQMLLSPNGDYVFDYNGVGIDQNTQMLALGQGYQDGGINLLQDAELNRDVNERSNLNSSFNMTWNIAKGINWNTLATLSRSRMNSTRFRDANSSDVRRRFNEWGEPLFDADGALQEVMFHVPAGAVFSSFSSSFSDWNVRSGIGVDKSLGQHRLRGGMGFAIRSNTFAAPDTPLPTYGITPRQPQGQPLAFESLDYTMLNYWRDPVFAASLLTPTFGSTARSRQLNWNGNLGYNYLERYGVEGYVNAIFSPLNNVMRSSAQRGSYLPLYVYGGRVSWRLSNERFFPKSRFLNEFKLSGLLNSIKLPEVADRLSGVRITQTFWQNMNFLPQAYTLSQWTGQTVHNTGLELSARLDSSKLDVVLGYNVSSFGRVPQWQVRVNYDLKNSHIIRLPRSVNKLEARLLLKQQDPYQVLASQLATNMSPAVGGNYSMMTSTIPSSMTLPQGITYLNAGVALGMFADRLLFSTDLYRQSFSGLSPDVPFTPDPAGGMGRPLLFSTIRNQGIEVYLKGIFVETKDLDLSLTVNGAYNENIALDVPPVNYSADLTFLRQPMSGQSVNILRSYRWAGLDAQGNPQIYDNEGQVLAVTDASTGMTNVGAEALVVSGLTRAPWSGAIIPECHYKGCFASARFILSYGAVMRRYMPNVSQNDAIYNNLIAMRWQQPGEGRTTDVAAAARSNMDRELVIQNSSNSVVSADYIRLREVQLGYEFSDAYLKKRLPYLKTLSLSLQMNNVYVWTRNKFGIDPEFVSNIGLPFPIQPVQYSFTLNTSF